MPMGRGRGRVIDLRDRTLDAEPAAQLDGELLARVRAGDDSAYGELWARHAANARRTAARLVPRADVEDLVSEAFERTLAAIRSGHGPEATFFPYVAQAMRGRAATMLAGKARVTLADNDDALDSPVEDDDPFIGHPAKGRLLRAFHDLPPRWQDALWVSVVEAEPPRKVATLLGTSPNGVSAMVIRARRRLRDNFIDLSAAESDNPLCRNAIQSPARYAEHLRSCEHCESTIAGLAELDVTLRSRGALVAGLLASLLTHASAPHRRVKDLFAAVPAKAAAAVVAVTAAGAAATPFLLAPSAQTATAPGPRPAVVRVQAERQSAPPRVLVTSGSAPDPARPPTPSAHLPALPAVSPPAPRAARPAASPTATRPVPEAPAADPTPAWTKHRLTITARPDRACGCARFTIKHARPTDRVVVRRVVDGIVTGWRVFTPDHRGTLHVRVAGLPAQSGHLVARVDVTRANGRTVSAQTWVPHRR